MRLSNHHMELNEQGEGKCSVPMWIGGIPAGFCDRPAFGVSANPDAPFLACQCHGGPQEKPPATEARFPARRD